MAGDAPAEKQGWFSQVKSAVKSAVDVVKDGLDAIAPVVAFVSPAAAGVMKAVSTGLGVISDTMDKCEQAGDLLTAGMEARNGIQELGEIGQEIKDHSQNIGSDFTQIVDKGRDTLTMVEGVTQDVGAGRYQDALGKVQDMHDVASQYAEQVKDGLDGLNVDEVGDKLRMSDENKGHLSDAKTQGLAGMDRLSEHLGEFGAVVSQVVDLLQALNVIKGDIGAASKENDKGAAEFSQEVGEKNQQLDGVGV